MFTRSQKVGKSQLLTTEFGLGLPAAPVFASQPGERPPQQGLSHGAPPLPPPAGLGGAEQMFQQEKQKSALLLLRGA